MQQLLAEIRIALDNRLYFIALQAALTIPDICGAVQSDNGDATREKYCHWYDRYAKNSIGQRVMAEDVYLFRCSLLHQASTIPNPRGKQKSPYSRIMFVAPYNDRFIMHNSVLGGVLVVDIGIFCNGLLAAAEKWKADMEKEQNANYNKNFEKTIRYYPQGFPPYIAGTGVIG